MPLAHWYTGLVTDIREIAPEVRSFTLEVPETGVFYFKAGQFITFDLPVSEKRINRWRSYSIASPPGKSNVIELCIVRFEQGIGSSYFFNEITIGSSLKFKGPEGGFVLPDHIDHDLVLVCTGTGVAPFRSMLLDLKNNPRPHRDIHLIFGTRKQSDILYHEEFIQLQNELPGFTFDVALSRENLNGNPVDYMHAGYVHPIYQKAYPLFRPDIHFYLCGWSQMIDEAVANLFVKMKFPREQIHYELYG
jgi:ferredoxin-NADP reductase